jgi:hypothetical protein
MGRGLYFRLEPVRPAVLQQAWHGPHMSCKLGITIGIDAKLPRHLCVCCYEQVASSTDDGEYPAVTVTATPLRVLLRTSSVVH